MVLAMDVEPRPALTKAEKTVRDEFFEGLRKAWMAMVTKMETEVALKDLNRRDFDVSNEALARLADRTGALYGLHASVALRPEKVGKTVQSVVSLSGRVVRSDGKLMSKAAVSSPRHNDPIPEVLKALMGKLFEELGLKDLPTFIEAPPVVASAPAPRAAETDAPRVVTLPPPPMPPPEVRAEERSSLRPVGYTVVGVGAAAMIAGIVTFAVAPEVHKDAYGNVAPGDLGTVRGTYTQQAVGVGFIVGGAAVAAGGAALLLLASHHDSAVRTSVAPTAGGATLTLQGSF